MKRIDSFLIGLFALLGSACQHQEAALLPYVNTYVGTAPSETHTAGLFGKNTEEYGQTLPAVLEPNGMNFWTPQTQDTERKCKAPYYYKDTRLQGFRNSHWIVGGCTQDYGSMTLMPVAGPLRCQPEARAAAFTHEKETSTPAYYAVQLPDYQLTAEMTGRSRSAIFRFTYNQTGEAHLVVNPNSDEGQGYIEIDTLHHQIRGCNPVHRIYQGWGEPAGFSGHFVIEYREQPSAFGTFHGDTVFAGHTRIEAGSAIGAYISFPVKAGQQLVVKAASSFTDSLGAIGNLQAEIPHWDFDRTRQELEAIWEQQLGKITVETHNQRDKRKFYSALYRASFLPRTFNDADGRYPAFGKGTSLLQTRDGHNYYEDYSMWDTYRALHPLINLLSPAKAGDMMQSLVDKYEQGGWLPIFPCWNSYTAAMIGDHCIAAIGDAYLKGIRGFDIERAYEGMRKNAFETPSWFEDYRNGMGRRALDSYLEKGYIPLEDSVKEAYHTCEQVSRTLEYAYDDFVLAQVAKALGKTDDYQVLAARARNYRNVIDPSTGYVQGRRADGTYLTEDNAFRFTRFITEGAPCHYTWYVPHDVEGLMECMGGKEAFVAKLDSMFSERRYWHGNEPCHQIAYLYDYAGQPQKTQRQVRHILDTEYLDTPGGLSGNDDAGQMSAWYLFSAMGFYPVCPGTPYYMMGSPVFPKLELHLENGKTFTLIAENASAENIYIEHMELNGKPYDKYFLTHEDILNGGILKVRMKNEE
ncbi:MAG: GH92 family glycosyl hydrolase [Bacteroidales bacterium]|nr:GH92 family glycosyl hydrolase [Bacteroidales bacterium]